MKEYVQEMRKKLVETFGAVGRDYFEAGLALFHRYRRSDSKFGQAAIGNLSSGVEMILKSHIAWRDIATVFTDLPPQAKLMLSNPESIPRFYTWRNMNFDIGSREYRTLDFESCVECYYVLFPHLKQILMPHVNVLASLRRASLTDLIPDLTGFDIDRIGYAAITIVDSVASDESYDYVWHFLTEDDRAFLRLFEEKRGERVRMSVEQARQATHGERVERLDTVVSTGWDSYVTICPVCKSAAGIDGYTALAVGGDEDGDYPMLDFFATAFKCSNCGLVLYDTDEMKIAGLTTIIDRSDDIDRWFEDHGGYSELSGI